MKKLVIIGGVVLWSTLGFGDWWITTVDSNAYIDSGADIVLDSLGYPYVAYGRENVKQGHLRYAIWNPLDSSWTTEYVGPWGGPPRMVFDSQWRPHIIWFWSYGYKDSNDWHVTDLTGCWDDLSSLEIDNEDKLHVGWISMYYADTAVFHAYTDSRGRYNPLGH